MNVGMIVVCCIGMNCADNLIEGTLEYSMFASRWLMAPVYVVLCLSLAFITIKVFQSRTQYISNLILAADDSIEAIKALVKRCW